MRRTFLIASVVLLIAAPHFANAASLTFDQYAANLSSRSARNFMANGQQFAQPEYGIPEFTLATSPRYRMLIAAYFRFQAQDGDVDAIATLKTTTLTAARLLENLLVDPSFENAQAWFLLLRMTEQFPDLFSDEERSTLFAAMASYAAKAVVSPDTENRALITASHWSYIINRLEKQKLLSTAQVAQYRRQLKTMVDRAVAATVTPDRWYRENGKFSVHYQAVAAFNLLSYARFAKQPREEMIALAMYRNLTLLALKNGMVEARLGARPVGLGAQFYVMMGVMGTIAKDADAPVFFAYAQGDRFFSDKRYPDRLEFHSTKEGSTPQFHDDIAFSDVVELASVLPRFSTGIPIMGRTVLASGTKAKRDGDFAILNTGTSVQVTDRRAKTVSVVRLGSHGNWTRIERRTVR